MKKLNLDETWRLCLQMWRWIDEQIEKHDMHCWENHNLKSLWLKKQRIKRHVLMNCFFCDYAEKRNGLLVKDNNSNYNCPECPARLVNRKFNCEKWKSYCWCDNPRAFYVKLVALNKIRLAKKRR